MGGVVVLLVVSYEMVVQYRRCRHSEASGNDALQERLLEASLLRNELELSRQQNRDLRNELKSVCTPPSLLRAQLCCLCVPKSSRPDSGYASAPHRWRIQPEQLNFDHKVAGGAEGEVWKGTLMRHGVKPCVVACWCLPGPRV